MYTVKEAFYTLQGEGMQAGRAAVFVRFTGCNLWSGRESDRKTARCRFCDTDFVGTDSDSGGGRYTAPQLADRVFKLWNAGCPLSPPLFKPLVVCTGGEPLLQLDEDLLKAFHSLGFEVAVESNGTVKAPEGIDWLCISPKTPRSELKQTSGHELKLVYPQDVNHPDDFRDLNFTHFFIQPKEGLFDGTDTLRNRESAVEYCLSYPQWRLSLQTHKILGLR